MPQLTEFDRGYKIHKLMLYQRLNFHLSETCKRVLSSSKRILLVFSEKFLNEEWNNKIFHDFIKHIYQTDLTCILIIVNLSNINEYKSKIALNEIKSKNVNNIKKQQQVKQNHETCISRLRSHIKHSVGLNNLEYLNWTDYNFWKQLNYILPFRNINQITKISKYSYDITNTSSSIESSSVIEKNKKISSIRSLSKKRNRKVSEFNVPRIIANTDDDVTSVNNNNTIKEDNSSLPSIKKIIVPIPNEMRTQLGSFKITNTDKNEIFLTNSSKLMNSNFELDKQLFSKTKLHQQRNSDNQMTSNISKKSNTSKHSSTKTPASTNRYRRKSETSSNNE